MILKASGLSREGRGETLCSWSGLRSREDLRLGKARIKITVHASAATKTVFTRVCDDYALTANGIGERLRQTFKKLFEI